MKDNKAAKKIHKTKQKILKLGFSIEESLEPICDGTKQHLIVSCFGYKDEEPRRFVREAESVGTMPGETILRAYKELYGELNSNASKED